MTKGYILITELKSENSFDGFASSISFYDNQLFIGASTSNTVFIYKPDKDGNFRVFQTIKPTDIFPQSKFGCAISVSGSYGKKSFI